jgi:LuxR family maltose regulon positive regulatory protein
MANDPTMARRPRGGKAAQLEPPNLAFAPVQTRLLAELTASVTPQTKLITIVAPTGYGKSTCATALYRHYVGLGLNSVWIALDDRDTSTERVIGLLEDALVDRESDSHPTQTLLRGDELLEDRVDALQDLLARQPEPTLLFIDNLGYCQDETLGYLLDRLVYKSPTGVHFLLSSTEQLPLNLARAKLEGRVREIGYADLAMRSDEIRRFFGTHLCTQLGDAGLEAIERHTEGWPAALRLAQIVLNNSPQPLEALARFSGADEDLSDLLNRQVLAGFAPEVRAFLLDIAPLRSFCADLCRQVTGDEDTAKHLALLLRRNVFVIPLDRNRSWYRLHGLFREFLIEEAQRSVPAERRLLVLTRAAEWNERGGHWQDAIDLALAANSAPLASSVLERVASMFVRDRGDLRQYIEWIEALHRGGHQVGLEADFWYVFALVFHRRYETARQHNERLVRRIEREPPAVGGLAALADFRRRIEVIRVCIDTYTDRLGDALAISSRWLTERGNDDPFDVATVSAAAGISLISGFRFVEARQVMRTAQAAIAQTDSAYGVGWVSMLAAMVGLAEGEYAGVHTDLYAALSRARAALGDNAGITRTIAFVAARCAVEMGLDAEARTLLAQGLRGAHTHGIVDTTAEGLEAAVKLWSGRADDPVSIPQLREIAASYPPRLALMLSCLLVQRLIRLGRLDDALSEGATIGLSALGLDPRQAAIEGMEVARAADLYAGAQLELLIAAGQLRHAESLIGAETRLARAEGRHARLVELALAEMAVAICSHNPQPAARHFVRAVGIAARRRILRPFRDRAETIAGLVNETKPQSWGFALDEERRFFVEICNGLPLTNSFLVEHFDQLQGDGALLETPTARELQLLALIEAGLSNQQLADRLSLSVATVKWHLYNLYTKLGVSSRSAALARARALNLLSR